MDADGNVKSAMFNNNSYLSIGIVVMLLFATLWIKNGQSSGERAVELTAADLAHYKEIQTEQQKLVNSKLDNLLELFKTATSDRFTGKEAHTFARQLKELNPDLRVPDVP